MFSVCFYFLRFGASPAMQTASKTLYDCISEVYEPEWTGHDLMTVQSQNIEILCQDLGHKLTDQVLIPLNTYQGQFPEMRVTTDFSFLCRRSMSTLPRHKPTSSCWWIDALHFSSLAALYQSDPG